MRINWYKENTVAFQEIYVVIHCKLHNFFEKQICVFLTSDNLSYSMCKVLEYNYQKMNDLYNSQYILYFLSKCTGIKCKLFHKLSSFSSFYSNIFTYRKIKEIIM